MRSACDETGGGQSSSHALTDSMAQIDDSGKPFLDNEFECAIVDGGSPQASVDLASTEGLARS